MVEVPRPRFSDEPSPVVKGLLVVVLPRSVLPPNVEAPPPKMEGAAANWDTAFAALLGWPKRPSEGACVVVAVVPKRPLEAVGWDDVVPKMPPPCAGLDVVELNRPPACDG